MTTPPLLAFIAWTALHAVSQPTQPVVSWQELPSAHAVIHISNAPVKKNPDDVGVDVTARAATVVDIASGQRLFAKNADQAMPIASLTKLMTAMTFLDEHPQLDRSITITPDDTNVDGHRYFADNERMTESQAFQSMLIGSVNAAANALAHAEGTRENFIQAMNQKARTIHLQHAHFVDPVGISPDNQASAEDVAMILRAALQYPEIRQATELSSIDVPSQIGHPAYHIVSTDLLIHSYLNAPPYRIVLAKTGSLPEAGFCLAQITRDAQGDQIVVVVLDSQNHLARFQDNKALAAWTFEHFEWPKI